MFSIIIISFTAANAAHSALQQNRKSPNTDYAQNGFSFTIRARRFRFGICCMPATATIHGLVQFTTIVKE